MWGLWWAIFNLYLEVREGLVMRKKQSARQFLFSSTGSHCRSRSRSDLVSSCNLSKVPIPPSRSYLLGRTTNILQTLHGGPYVWRQLLSWQDPVSCLTWKTKISSVIVVVISDKLLELRSSYFTFMEDSEFLFINLDSWNLIDWGCYTEIVVRKCIIKIRVRMMGLSVATSQTLRTRD